MHLVITPLYNFSFIFIIAYQQFDTNFLINTNIILLRPGKQRP
jgi:hypothetical protein